MEKTYNVLIIAADNEDSASYKEILTNTINCEISQYFATETALDSIKELNNYDLVLLDYDLPGQQGGMDFLQKLRDHKVLLSGPIVILTNDGSEDIALHLMRFGITDYITKGSITAPVLSAVIRNALNKYQVKLVEQQNYKNYNIVIIEDSPDDYELYERIIKKSFACSVLHFTSAEKALETLKEGGRSDIILIDYNLPGMNGMSFVSHMRQHHIAPDSPIIVLTGQGNENIAVNFMRLGINDYIQKNQINHQSLTVAIRDAFEKVYLKKMHNEKQKELLLFAHTLAHDLKNPINRIDTYARLLNKNPAKSEIYSKNIAEDAAFLVQFIDQLLVYAEFGRGTHDQKEIDLNNIVNQSIRNLDTSIEKSNAVITIENELPKIYGSEISLIQLFQNIISNSIKYNTNTPKININCRSQKEFSIISVTDNGIGIPNKEINHIFKPFHRVANDMNSPGTGLGLALVKTIADQHNAKLRVKSVINGGTQFDIMFHL